MVKLFLDVDGVLNVFPWKNHRGQWDDFVTEPVTTGDSTYKMTISKKCCEQLSSLPVDIEWLTTWGSEANTKLSSLTGFDKLPVFAHIELSNFRSQWKFNAVRNWYESSSGESRFVWIDDDAIPGHANRIFPEALLIRTDERVGITPDHIETIRSYCQESRI